MHRLLTARECGEEVHGIDDISSERWTKLEVDQSRSFKCDPIDRIRAIDLDTPSGQLLLCAGLNFDDRGGAVAIHFYPVRDSKVEDDPVEVHFHPESDGVRCVKWFPNDAAIFLTGNHRRLNMHSWAEVHVWDTDCFRSVSHFRMDEPGVRALDLSSAPGARQELIATVVEGAHDLRLLDMNSGASTHRLAGHQKPLNSVRWAPLHPFLLVSGDEGGQVCLFDVRRSGRDACLLKFDCSRRFNTHEQKTGFILNGYTSLNSNTGELRAVKRQRIQQLSRNSDKPLLGLGCAWRPELSKQARRHKRLEHPGQATLDTFGAAQMIRFSIDGTQVISTGRGTSFRLWDLITGRMISEFHDTSLYTSSREQYMQMAGDGIHMIWGVHGELQVIDVQDGMMVHTAEADAERFHGMVVHPLEEEVISAHRNELKVWSYETDSYNEPRDENENVRW
ncbi:unnamed protein product [Agarophyton chilense]